MFSVASLEISFHRVGPAGWPPRTVLRSWADAPWRVVDDGVAVACLPGEVVWLGVANSGEPARVTLSGSGGRGARSLTVPPDWQIDSVLDDAGRAQPLALRDGRTTVYRLEVDRGSSAPGPVILALSLLAPGAWAERFERIDLAPAVEPPPVQRYSRIARPGMPPSGGHA